MTVRPKATFAAAEMQDDADLLDEPTLSKKVGALIRRRLEEPVDVCDRLEAAWSPKTGRRVTLSPKLREQIRFGLASFTYHQQGQDAREAAEQAGAIVDGVARLKAALGGCGRDLLARIELELGFPASDALFPIRFEVERLERAVSRARDRLPKPDGQRGPTILAPLTWMLADVYMEAVGKKPGTRQDGPFVRGVLAVHDALPLRLQEQNAPGALAAQIRLRGGGEYRQAVVDALARMTKEGEWQRRESERAAYRHRLAESASWLTAHPWSDDALRSISEAGGSVEIGSALLHPVVERALAKHGLVRRYAEAVVGLTRLGEEVLAGRQATEHGQR